MPLKLFRNSLFLVLTQGFQPIRPSGPQRVQLHKPVLKLVFSIRLPKSFRNECWGRGRIFSPHVASSACTEYVDLVDAYASGLDATKTGAVFTETSMLLASSMCARGHSYRSPVHFMDMIRPNVMELFFGDQLQEFENSELFQNKTWIAIAGS